MEFLLLILIIFYGTDPKLIGLLLAKAEIWKEYYRKEDHYQIRREVAKARLNRIRKKYPEAFTSQNPDKE